MTASDALAKADALHKALIVLDGHLDIPLDFGEPGREADIDGPGQFDLPKARRGGLSGATVCVAAPLARSTPAGVASGRAAHERKFAAIQKMVETFPDQAALAKSPDHLREIAASGRLAVTLALQNAAPFDGELEAISAWAARGVQMIGLTFIGNNAFADSARPYPFAGAHDNGGLSDLGREAIGLMNDLGVMVDVSQFSDAALADTLKVAKAPVIASHSAPRGVLETRRNLPDEDLRAIADNGGMVNIVGFANYLAPNTADVHDQLRAMWMRYGLTDCQKMDDAIFHPATAEWEDERFWEFLHEFHVILDLANPHATVAHYVDAVAYVVDKIGIEHVGLSSDFNHGGGVLGWRNSGETRNVTAELVRRGFSDQDIARLWGENFLTLWGKVQAGARAERNPLR
jgi:microsomal dipeptidase-like Zn-dependent dipeptidase